MTIDQLVSDLLKDCSKDQSTKISMVQEPIQESYVPSSESAFNTYKQIADYIPRVIEKLNSFGGSFDFNSIFHYFPASISLKGKHNLEITLSRLNIDNNSEKDDQKISFKLKNSGNNEYILAPSKNNCSCLDDYVRDIKYLMETLIKFKKTNLDFLPSAPNVDVVRAGINQDSNQTYNKERETYIEFEQKLRDWADKILISDENDSIKFGANSFGRYSVYIKEKSDGNKICIAYNPEFGNAVYVGFDEMVFYDTKKEISKTGDAVKIPRFEKSTVDYDWKNKVLDWMNLE